MTEVELIKKIKRLKEIKPRKDWVLLTKSQVLDFKRERLSFFAVLGRLVLQPRMVSVFFVILGLFLSVFSFAQNSLPGDLLYPIKKIAEKGQAIFVSEANKPKVQLEQANKRLEELAKIAAENQTPKLAPALDEFQNSVNEAAKNLKKSQKVTKEIVDQTKKLIEKREEVKTLGIVVGGGELDDALSQIVENEIKDLEKRTLTEDQEKLLKEAKESFDAGNLTGALEKILQMNPK